MTSTRTSVQRWAAGGLALGLLFVAAGWAVAFAHSPNTTLATKFIDEPVLWIVTFTPAVLLVIGGLLGLALTQFQPTRAGSMELVDRVAEEISAAIHARNVETVRTGGIQAEYFASLSHDMRTPLSAIIGFSAIVEDSENITHADLLTYMREIGSSANNLLGVITDLLDAAKLENGSIEIQISDVDGDDIAAEVLRHLDPLIQGKHLTVKTNLKAATPCRADEQRLRQILTNLVSNSIKYTPAGIISVNSYVRGDAVIYEVVDTGLGISKDDMTKIFTPFEQTDAGRARTDSTGLGLPIALGMAQAMDGTIEAESGGVGKGSTFRLVLPVGSGRDAEIKLASLPVVAA